MGQFIVSEQDGVKFLRHEHLPVEIPVADLSDPEAALCRKSCQDNGGVMGYHRDGGKLICECLDETEQAAKGVGLNEIKRIMEKLWTAYRNSDGVNVRLEISDNELAMLSAVMAKALNQVAQVNDVAEDFEQLGKLGGAVSKVNFPNER
jgi:hypothetical protein